MRAEEVDDRGGPPEMPRRKKVYDGDAGGEAQSFIMKLFGIWGAISLVIGVPFLLLGLALILDRALRLGIFPR
jgi:hypothetical protein